MYNEIHTYIHTYIRTHKYTHTTCIECAYVKMRYIHIYIYIHIYMQYVYTCAQIVRHAHQHICRLDMHLEQVEDR